MNPPTITLRPAQTKDAERLIDIHYASVQHISEAFYPREILNAWSPTPSLQRHQWMRDTIESPERIVWVAQHNDNEISAFAIASATDGFIHALYVDHYHHGSEIGGEALQAVLDGMFHLSLFQGHLRSRIVGGEPIRGIHLLSICLDHRFNGRSRVALFSAQFVVAGVELALIGGQSARLCSWGLLVSVRRSLRA